MITSHRSSLHDTIKEIGDQFQSADPRSSGPNPDAVEVTQRVIDFLKHGAAALSTARLADIPHWATTLARRGLTEHLIPDGSRAFADLIDGALTALSVLAARDTSVAREEIADVREDLLDIQQSGITWKSLPVVEGALIRLAAIEATL